MATQVRGWTDEMIYKRQVILTCPRKGDQRKQSWSDSQLLGINSQIQDELILGGNYFYEQLP
jgi:hypothetical protein